MLSLSSPLRLLSRPVRDAMLARARLNLATGPKTAAIEACDSEQAQMMSEKLILVDADDNELGSATKFDAHRLDTVLRLDLLHRAFSVFIFDANGSRLLMQLRAETKITFPGLWTNACCSHPIIGSSEGPKRDGESERDGATGCASAVRRKLYQELRVTEHELTEMHYITRIHYAAPSPPVAEDGGWCEHEIDYIFIARMRKQGHIPSNFNRNEVSDMRYVTESELEALPDSKLTPWFRMIKKTFLPMWWAHVREDTLEKCWDHNKIRRM